MTVRLRQEATFETLLITLGVLLLPGPLIEVFSLMVGTAVQATQSIAVSDLPYTVVLAGPPSLVVVAALLMIFRPAFWRRLLSLGRQPPSVFYCVNSAEFWQHCVQVLGVGIAVPQFALVVRLTGLYLLNADSLPVDPPVQLLVAAYGSPFLAAVAAILIPGRIAALLRLRSDDASTTDTVGDLAVRRCLVANAVVLFVLYFPFHDSAVAVLMAAGSPALWQWLPAGLIFASLVACVMLRRRFASLVTPEIGLVCESCGLVVRSATLSGCPECRGETLTFANSDAADLPSFWIPNWCVLFGAYIACRQFGAALTLVDLIDQRESLANYGWLLSGIILVVFIAGLMVLVPDLISAGMRNSTTRVSVVLFRLAGIFCLMRAVGSATRGMFYSEIGFQSVRENAEFVQALVMLVFGFVLLYRRFDGESASQ